MPGHQAMPGHQQVLLPIPSLGAFFSWWWAQALMLVLSYVLVPWCYFGWIVPTKSKYVGPYFSPIIEWFDHLRSKIKRTANNTINCFNSNLFVRCLKTLLRCVIFTPITAPLKLFRMWSKWYLQPDLKRERMRRERVRRAVSSCRVWSTNWRGLP